MAPIVAMDVLKYIVMGSGVLCVMIMGLLMKQEILFVSSWDILGPIPSQVMLGELFLMVN